MTAAQQLSSVLATQFPELAADIVYAFDEVTMTVDKEQLYELGLALRDTDTLSFTQLTDLCAVDYAEYGQSTWSTAECTSSGFDRAVTQGFHEKFSSYWDKPRFAVVYHLLSVKNNYRLRLRVFVDEQEPLLGSVINIWPVANWYEREAFDLFGILFNGHPDLRRILTDYGFIGYPFRKDFPVSGYVEMRYDAAQQRVVYEPVSIKPRVLVPRVIRDSRNTAKKDQT